MLYPDGALDLVLGQKVILADSGNHRIYLVAKIHDAAFVDIISTDDYRRSVSITELVAAPSKTYFGRGSDEALCHRYLMLNDELSKDASAMDAEDYYKALGPNGCEACPLVKRCPVCIVNE